MYGVAPCHTHEPPHSQESDVMLTPPIRRGIRALTISALAVAAVACADKAVEETTESVQALTTAMPAAAPPIADFSGRGVALGKAGGVRRERDLSKEREGAQATGIPAPRPSQTAAAGMIIRNGDVSVEVDSLETGIERVRQLATSLGGFIGN